MAGPDRSRIRLGRPAGSISEGLAPRPHVPYRGGFPAPWPLVLSRRGSLSRPPLANDTRHITRCDFPPTHIDPRAGPIGPGRPPDPATRNRGPPPPSNDAPPTSDPIATHSTARESVIHIIPSHSAISAIVVPKPRGRPPGRAAATRPSARASGPRSRPCPPRPRPVRRPWSATRASPRSARIGRA
jgi:hypothetical protein